MTFKVVFVGIACLLLGGTGGWILSTEPSSLSRTGLLDEGPWGPLTAWTIRIEPPSEFFGTDINFSYQGHWEFPSMSLAQVQALLAQAGLPTNDLNRLLRTAQPNREGSGILLLPDSTLIASMPPETRAKIYFRLAEWAVNETQANPRVYTENSLNESFEDAPPGVAEKVRRLLYSDGKLFYFADAKLVFDGIPTEEDRRKYLRSISQVRAQLVKLHVSHGVDVGPIVSYWHHDARAKDHEVLLESIARRPKGGEIDIVHLLPRFARKLLYTYPQPSSSQPSEWKNCHWTSLNFFSGDAPDDGFLDPQKVATTLKQNYAQIVGRPKLGDLVLFERGGQVIHSANYIAADILFTKNGNSPLRPWVLMKQEDVSNFYSLPGPPLLVRYFRKNP